MSLKTLVYWITLPGVLPSGGCTVFNLQLHKPAIYGLPQLHRPFPQTAAVNYSAELTKSYS